MDGIVWKASNTFISGQEDREIGRWSWTQCSKGKQQRRAIPCRKPLVQSSVLVRPWMLWFLLIGIFGDAVAVRGARHQPLEPLPADADTAETKDLGVPLQAHVEAQVGPEPAHAAQEQRRCTDDLPSFGGGIGTEFFRPAEQQRRWMKDFVGRRDIGSWIAEMLAGHAPSKSTLYSWHTLIVWVCVPAGFFGAVFTLPATQRATLRRKPFSAAGRILAIPLLIEAVLIAWSLTWWASAVSLYAASCLAFASIPNFCKMFFLVKSPMGEMDLWAAASAIGSATSTGFWLKWAAGAQEPSLLIFILQGVVALLFMYGWWKGEGGGLMGAVNGRGGNEE